MSFKNQYSLWIYRPFSDDSIKKLDLWILWIKSVPCAKCYNLITLFVSIAYIDNTEIILNLETTRLSLSVLLCSRCQN